jgi:hypothetical protein
MQLPRGVTLRKLNFAHSIACYGDLRIGLTGEGEGASLTDRRPWPPTEPAAKLGQRVSVFNGYIFASPRNAVASHCRFRNRQNQGRPGQASR